MRRDQLHIGPIPRILFFVVLGACIVGMRAYTFGEPLDHDITTNYFIGHEMLKGRQLYADLWEHKPPLIYLTYAFGELMFGYGPRAIFGLNVCTTFLTAMGVFLGAFRLSKSAVGGACAALLWSLVSGDLALQANQPTTEAFSNCCLVWAFNCFLGSARRPVLAYAGGGLLIALASLYKPVYFGFATLACVAHLFAGNLAGNVKVKQILALVGAVTGVWCAMLIYFWASGTLPDFFEAIFVYNRSYIGSTKSLLLKALDPQLQLPSLLYFAIPLYAATLACLINILKRAGKQCEDWWIFAAYVIGSMSAICIQGTYVPHVYQNWLPVLCVGGGSAIGLLLSTKAWQKFAIATAALLLAVVLAHELPNYTLTPEKWSSTKFGTGFIEAYQMGSVLRRALLPNDSFYEWGQDSALYFVTEKSPVAGAFSNDGLLGGPLAHKLCNRTLKQLEKSSPAFVITDEPTSVASRNPTYGEFICKILRNYRCISDRPVLGRFYVYARCDEHLGDRTQRFVAALESSPLH